MCLKDYGMGKIIEHKSPGMMRKLSVLVMLFLILPLTSCSTFLSEKYNAQVSPGQCLPFFPDQDGWYGGDGAYSIMLDEKRTLWVFGDTFVAGETGRKNRLGMDVVLGTTLAISTCSEKNDFEIQYYLKKSNREFISSFGENEWLWPQDPFMVNRVLYIPLIAIEPGDRPGELFNFRVAGHKFARIKDFSTGNPHAWEFDYIDLTPALPKEIAAFAATSVVHNHHVYFYPFYVYFGEDAHVMGNILARIPVDKIDHPTEAIEYFTREGTWEKSLNPLRVKVVLDASVSELSVRYHALTGQWIAVYMSTRHQGDQMFYQWSDKPEGPWSSPKALGGKVPEVDPDSPLYDANNFCYAGKEHVQYSRHSDLVVTYVCNSMEDFEKEDSFIRRNTFLYRPVVRKVNCCE